MNSLKSLRITESLFFSHIKSSSVTSFPRSHGTLFRSKLGVKNKTQIADLLKQHIMYHQSNIKLSSFKQHSEAQHKYIYDTTRPKLSYPGRNSWTFISSLHCVAICICAHYVSQLSIPFVSHTAIPGVCFIRT